MKSALLFGIVLWVTSIAAGSKAPSDVPAPYEFLFRGGISAKEVEKAWAGLPYESIRLERYGCYGDCPIYTVELWKGGRAKYHGKRHVSRVGEFTGRVGLREFARLCYLIDEIDYFELNRSYAAPWTDDATVVVSVVRAESGEPFDIRDYGRFGPPSLWALQLAIDRVADEIEWNED
jgi:hypothetical protein